VERQIERAGRMDNVTVNLDIPQGVPPVLADQVQVGQIVLNLLTNAVQAMGERGGTLTVRAEVDGSRVRLLVTDEGHGIALENMDKIFEPLFTTKARGMGLGLAVSRALAIANGGDITVESRQGQGATFTLILPQVGQMIAA
jgi:signal transduction histidine kinase